ncbi:MAG: radical SAM protein [Candidatus Bathyarchaeota archaeon]|nr:MAG: radical SAM protein [Candidatus Bathyarchaeota archaeon]
MWTFLRPDATAVLRDKKARTSLSRYFNVMQDDKPAKFTIAKRLSAHHNPQDPPTKLWQLHDQLTQEFCSLEKEIDTRRKTLQDLPTPEQSYLDLKSAIVNRMLGNCHLCTHQCHVNRHTNELGYCRCGTRIIVSTIFQHMGEEPELVPSGTIFTLGCTLQCLHCQNWTISQWYEDGEIYTPTRLAKAVEQLRKRGSRNANLVGGEPTPWLQQWLETFKHINTNIPIVWNSNSYYSRQTAKLLAGFVDLYLLDFKYGNNQCAERISDAPKYWEASTRNHLHAKKYGELIIRVLVLPEHLDCCTKPILNWIAENLGKGTRVNVMFQYHPEWKAKELPELRRRLTKKEREDAIRLAKEAGLTNFIT